MNRILGGFAVLVLAMCSATWAQGPDSRSGSQSRVALRFRRRMYPDYGENRHARRNHGAHEDPKGTVSRSGETAKRRARLHAEFRSDRGTSPGRYPCMEN